ncbi:hypothetical protein [Streptomyces sp. NRRL F-5630]|uniref:hypothetical protein n=1 Tax=Streptomyces sp. NRRL F-5630 TaxID=1463864 RepID=UPI003D7362F0
MPRIELAYWHAGHAPGDELTVSDEELAALRRDGRVARVIRPAAEPVTEAPAAQPEPGPASPGAARKKR